MGSNNPLSFKSSLSFITSISFRYFNSRTLHSVGTHLGFFTVQQKAQAQSGLQNSFPEILHTLSETA